MKTLKIIFWIIGVLTMLGIGAVLVITTLVDPNDYKPKLEQIVEANTGRQLNLKGDLGLTFYPWVGVNTGAMELSNREGFGDGPMLSVEQADIKIKLIPLLKKRFEIGEITLEKPRVQLITLRDGSTNWDDLMNNDKAPEATPGEDGAVAIVGLAVQGVSLVDGEVIWNDQKAGQQVTLTKMNLSTGQIQPGKPLDIKMSMDVLGNVTPEPATINFSTTTKVDDTFNIVELDESSITLKMGEKLYELEIPNLAMDVEKQILRIPEFAFAQSDFNVNGILNVSNVLTSPTLSGELRLVATDIVKMMSEYGSKIELGGNKIGNMNLNTGFSYLNNTVEINSLVADILINAQNTKLEIPFASLEFLHQKVGLPAFSIHQGGFKLDGSLTGDEVFSEPENLNLSGSLNLDISDLQNFLQLNQLGEILPAGLINTISSDMDYALKGGNLQISSMDTSMDEIVSAGGVTVKELFSIGGLDLTVKQDIQNVDIGKMLAALEVTEDLQGTGFVNLHLAGINPNAEKPMANMNGQIEFNLKNGAIKGFDLQATLIRLKNVVNSATGNEESQYQPDVQTKFSELTGGFNGTEGRFETNNISMKAPGLRVDGSGIVDFSSEQLDLKFDVSAVKSVEGQGGAGLEELEGVNIPLTVKGTLNSPSYGLDIGSLLKEEAKKEINKEVKKEISKQLLKLLGN